VSSIRTSTGCLSPASAPAIMDGVPHTPDQQTRDAVIATPGITQKRESRVNSKPQ